MPVIFVGQALCSVQDIVGAPLSSSSLTTTVRRLTVFILISSYQAQNFPSDGKMPLRIVTLPTWARPGIFIVEKRGLLPCRYSIGVASTARPLTS